MGQVGGTILNLSYSLSFFCGIPPSYFKVYGGVGGWPSQLYAWPSYMVSAPVPLGLFGYLNWVVLGWGLGTGLDNIQIFAQIEIYLTDRICQAFVSCAYEPFIFPP